MAIELISEGIKFFINRWIESRKKLEKNIDSYLQAAATDGVIKHTDILILKNKIQEIVDVTGNMNKAIKKGKELAEIDNLIDNGKNYIRILKEITDILPYKYLNKFLQLEGKVNEASFGEITVQIVEEEIALVCVYVSNNLLQWVFTDLLNLEYIEDDYEISKIGVQFLLSAQRLLHGKKKINDNLKYFTEKYLLIFKGLVLHRNEILYFFCFTRKLSMAYRDTLDRC